MNDSKFPEHAPAQKQTEESFFKRLQIVALGFLLGAITGVFGTISHLSISFVGGIGIPWGALLGLLLVVSTAVWLGAQLGHVLATAGVGLGAYMAAGLLAFLPTADTLNIPINDLTWQAAPAAVIAEVLWMLGIPVVTITGMVIVARRIRQAS